MRTAWLYGPPGNDFPEKIGRAAERARAAGEALRVVADETGSPTYTADIAEAIVELVGSGEPMAGIHHLVNAGRATRSDWARAVLAGLGIDVAARGGPGSDLAAGLDAAGLGGPRTDPPAIGRADPALGCRPGRLPAGPPAAAGCGAATAAPGRR